MNIPVFSFMLKSFPKKPKNIPKNIPENILKNITADTYVF